MEQKPSITFCPSCGKKLDGDETLCPFCGSRLVDVEIINNVQEIIEDTSGAADAVHNDTVAVEKEEKINTLLCISCHAQLDGNENICPYCGAVLREIQKYEEIITPVPPAAEVATEPVNAVVQQAVMTEKNEEVSSKKKHRGLWVVLIILFGFILVAGAVAFMQYKDVVNIRFLKNIIPSETEKIITGSVSRNYYFCYSTSVGYNSKEIAISGVFEKKGDHNTEFFAKSDFTGSFSKSYPKIYLNFRKPVCMKGATYEETAKKRENILKQYKNSKYSTRYIKVK